MKLFVKIFVLVVAVAVIGFGIFIYLDKTSIPAPSTNNLATPAVLPQTTETTFLAVGDIMLSRDVAKVMTKNGKDGFYPFRELDPLLSSTDFNFGNLESPFSGKDTQDPDPMTFTFNAPTWAMPGLAQYNFKVLNLANNHALNQGKAGMLFTKQYLADNYLVGVGTGNDADEAWQGAVYESKGIKIGFVGATYAPASPYLAQITDLTHLKASVADLETKSDFVVVAMHAGVEYTREPIAAQEKFARAAIDAGADMVIGAHPHWIQPIEKYKGKYIFYSLGNFVFDQSFSQDTKEGLTVKITLTKEADQTSLKQIQLIPVIINNAQPRLATESEKQSILKKINLFDEILNP